MLSYYDSLSFGVKKESFLFSFFISLIMLFLLALIGFSLERQYGILTGIKNFILATDDMGASVAGGKIFSNLEDPVFRLTISKKLASVFLWIFTLYFLLFSWQSIISKKELFQPNVRSTKSFFWITLGKMMILISPILFALHTFLPKLFFYGISFLVDAFLFQKNVAFKFPFDEKTCMVCAIGLLVYFIYVFTLFFGHFSFVSLLNLKLFLRRIKVVIELIFHIIMSVVWWVVCTAALFYICYKFDPLYVCFFALLIYFISTIASSSRWVFMMFFLLALGVGFGLSSYLGYNLFKKYMVFYGLGVLMYFTFFFIMGVFFSTLAYSFAATAYVFRFNQTPSKDVKQQTPEKLRRIDELYSVYLQEHKNDVQDNFFHHMEE